MQSQSKIQDVTRAAPCEVCGSHRRCARTDDGLHFCRYSRADRDGWRFLGETKDGQGMYRAEGDTRRPDRQAVDPQRALQDRLFAQWDAMEEWLAGPGANRRRVADAPAAQARLEQMYPHFGAATLAQLDVIFVPPTEQQLAEEDEVAVRLGHAFGMPECDGLGNVVGYNFVWPTRHKRSAGARGITIPQRLRNLTPDERDMRSPFDKATRPMRRNFLDNNHKGHRWDLYIVEGASDVLAMCEMGLQAVGRPSNCGGVPELTQWIRDHVPLWMSVIVVGENDRKDDGSHPGLEGAQRVSRQLADALPAHDVSYSMPPAGSKDVRQWYETQLRRKGRPTPARLGHDLESHLLAAAVAVEPGAVVPLIAVAQPAHQTSTEQIIEFVSRHLAEWRASQAAKAGQAVPVEIEHQGAEAAAVARGDDGGHMRCQSRRRIRVILCDRCTGEVSLLDPRCEQYEECPGCREWRIFDSTMHAAVRLGGAAKLYEMQVHPVNWGRVRDRIGRMGGEYMRLHDGDAYYVVTDVAHPDAIVTTAEIALGTVRLLLREWYCQARPMTTSHGWRKLRRDPDQAKERRGVAHRGLTETAMRQIADEVRAELKVSRCEATARVNTFARFVREFWPPTEIEYVVSCLMAGEALPRLLAMPAVVNRQPAADDPEAIPW